MVVFTFSDTPNTQRVATPPPPPSLLTQSALGLSPQQGSDSVDTEGSAPLHKRRVAITAGGGNLLIAEGSQLKLVSLRAIEDAARRQLCLPSNVSSAALDEEGLNARWSLDSLLSEYVDAWTLEAETVDFNIRQMSISPNERLIVVVGQHELAVITLPMGRGHRSKTQTQRCTNYRIGEQYHHTMASPIIKVDWHPLSESKSHIGVLTGDGLLRMYDIINDKDEPEVLIDLHARLNVHNDERANKPGSVCFSTALGADAVASFAFGRSEHSWTAMAAYVLMSSGELYTVCPIVPKRFRLSLHHVNILLAIAARERVDMGFSDDVSRASMLDQQISWLDALRTLPPQPTPDTSSMYSTILTGGETDQQRGNFIVADEYLQAALPDVTLDGPYLMCPAPWEINDEPYKACDLLCLSTSPSDLVTIAYDNGKVDILMITEPPEPGQDRQNAGQKARGLPSLVVRECYQLFRPYPASDDASSAESWPRLVADPMYGDLFYCYHPDGVYSVDCSTWLRPLERWWQSEGEHRLDERDLPGSVIKNLLRCTSEPHCEGAVFNNAALCAIQDSVISYSMMYLSPQLDLVLQMLPHRVETSSVFAGEDGEDEQVSLLETSQSQDILAALASGSTPANVLGSSGIAGDSASAYKTLLEPDLDPTTATDRLLALAKAMQETSLPRLVAPPQSLAAEPGNGNREVMEAYAKATRSTIETFLLQINTLRNAIIYMKRRSLRQQQEVRHQRQTIGRLREMLDTDLKKRGKAAQQRARQLAIEQNDLLRRTDQLGQHAATNRNHRLSRREKDFFEELGSIKSTSAKANDQVEQLRQEMKRLTEAGSSTQSSASPSTSTAQGRATGSSENKSQYVALSEALSVESELLDTAAERLKRLEKSIARLDLNRQTEGER